MAEDIESSKTEDDERKRAIARRFSELSFVPASSDIELSDQDAISLPLDKLSSLGVVAASIPEMFRTVSTTVKTDPGEQLFRALTPAGSTLKQSKDGLYSSAAKMADGSAAWAKYQAVDAATQEVSVTIPYDPTALAMTIALAQVNQKLDGIQDTLDEMFDYLLLKDKADLRASLDTLATVLSDYKFNWDNPQFKQAKYILVQAINRDARRHILELRAGISKRAKKKGLLELRSQADKSTEEVLDCLKEYQLAVYLYSFSTFLGVMLLENYDASYLESKAADIRQKALEYREMYTGCFEAIEQRSRESAESVLVEGIASGVEGLGRLLEKTPIGDNTQADEALVEFGSGLDVRNSSRNARITESLISAKDPVVIPFAESIDSVNRVYNQPCQLLTDGAMLYLLPEEGPLEQ